jgi:hypothetical protein
MSAISSLSPGTNSYATSSQNDVAQFIQDFNAVGSALQSGSVSDAQSALATLQQNLPGNSTASASQPFGRNSAANTDYQNLTSALQSSNLSGAQQAFASLQKDLQGTGKTGKGHGHHHHHHGSGSAPATSSTSTATTTPATSTNSTTASSTIAADDATDNLLLNVLA